jgi:hypothetical protein
MARRIRQGISRETMKALGELSRGMQHDGVLDVGYDENAPIGLGEQLEDAIDQSLVRPTVDELERLSPQPVRKNRPAIPPQKTIRQTKPSEDAKDIIWTIEVIPNIMEISNWRVSAVTPTRIDNGITDRTDIVIANMSQQVVWINDDAASLSAGPSGVPLRAMSGATAYDGGVFRARVTEAERFWAIGAGGANLLIVTVELARR